MERKPEDEPVRILDDMRERERRENWVIVNRHFASLFPYGSAPLAFPFEIANSRAAEPGAPVLCRAAGTIANSPFDIGLTDKRYLLYTRLDVLEKVARAESPVKVIDISLANRLDAKAAAEAIKAKWGFSDMETWMDVNAAALPFIAGIRISAYSGMVAIALLSILGMGIAITMTIEDRKRQLAILFAMGMNAVELRLIFLVAGVKLVFTASTAGIAAAYILALLSLPHWERMLESFFHPHQAGLAFSAASLVSMLFLLTLSSLATAWVASRMVTKYDPVVGLR
jgi:ABC-type lipoprotein release transport system permease subunit